MKKVQYIGPKKSISCVVPFGAKSKVEVASYVIFQKDQILELEDDYANKLVAHNPHGYRFADEDLVVTAEIKPAKKVKLSKSKSAEDAFAIPADLIVETIL